MNAISLQAGLTIAIFGGALLLLASQRIRVDLVALLVMLALIATRVLTPEEAFAALGRPLMIVVAGIYVVGGALRETGVAALLSRGILHWGSERRSLLLVLIMGAAGLFSAILSSLLVAVIFMPVVLRVGRKLELPATQLLMPLATAVLLGNQLTLIGTPTNLIVDDLLVQHGHPHFGFFTLTPYAAVSLALAIGWYWWMAQHTLPEKELESSPEPSIDEVEQSYGLSGNVKQVRVQPQSDLAGERLETSDLRRQDQLDVVAVESASDGEPAPAQPEHVLAAGDGLVLQGQPAAIRQSADQHNLADEGTVPLAKVSQTEQAALHLHEVVIPFRSELVGKSLAEIDLRRRYGLHVLAVNRQGETIRELPATFQVRTGDILLVQGSTDQVRDLSRRDDLAVISDLTPDAEEIITRKAKIALAVLGVLVVVVMFNWVSLAVALLAASVVLILTGCLSIEQAYAAIDAKIIVLLAGMLPLATALQQTGVAELLASLIAGVGEWIGAYGALLLLYLCTTLITQVAPNAVTAAVITPVALQLTAAQGQSAQTFAIAITFAASASYLTPLISAVNLLVKSKANYTLGDYLRNTLPIYALQVGAIFALLIWLR